MMRFILPLLLLLLTCPMGWAADTFVNIATLSPTATVTKDHVCYSDGRDIACGDRGVTLSTAGVLAGTYAAITNVSATTVNIGGLGVTGDIPSAVVLAFDLASCPAGWSAYSAGVGRQILGMGTNGNQSYLTRGVTGGSSTVVLTQTVMPTHLHTVNPSPQNTGAGSNHYHSIDAGAVAIDADTGHTHNANPDAKDSGSGDSSHAHDIIGGNGDTSGSIDGPIWYSSIGSTISRATGSVGTHTHNFNPDSFPSGAGSSHNHSLDVGSGTSGAGSAHYHNIDIDGVTSDSKGSGTAMNIDPLFVGLLYCSKD